MTPTSRGHNPDDSASKRRWRTPRLLFVTLDEELGFGLDAAAEHGANLCASYITPEMDCLVTPWAPLCARNCDGERIAFMNSPWGPKFEKCAPDCAKTKKGGGPHVHHAESFPGTGAFVDRAIDQLPTLDGIVLLLATAPDTSWWRAAFAASPRVRLLPRVCFIDPDTGETLNAPPGAGVTVFETRPGFSGAPEVVLADENGVIVSPRRPSVAEALQHIEAGARALRGEAHG